MKKRWEDVVWCFTDIDGFTQEFNTLTECKKMAKKHSKENPDFEVNIYAITSIYYENGKDKYSDFTI